MSTPSSRNAPIHAIVKGRITGRLDLGLLGIAPTVEGPYELLARDLTRDEARAQLREILLAETDPNVDISWTVELARHGFPDDAKVGDTTAK